GVISLALMLAGWWMLYLRAPQPPPLPAGAAVPDSLAGPGTTGYPGATFPQGGADPYTSQHTGIYTPYTKLPDQYVPDNPVQDDETASGTATSETTDTTGPSLTKTPAAEPSSPPATAAVPAGDPGPGTPDSTATEK